MTLAFAGVVLEVRVPWRVYQTKTYEASVRVRAHGRGRWRWVHVLVQWPRGGGRAHAGPGSITLEAKSWLTDESLRGNLRRKAFVRLQAKLGPGGAPDVGKGCPVLGPRGERCTWQRGHAAMVVKDSRIAEPYATRFAKCYGHSWAARRLAPHKLIVQEPRRPRPLVR